MSSPLLDHCPPGLPRDAYLSHEWFAHEMRAIWAREWVCVGRLGDLAPGTIRPLTLAGSPVIVCRTPDGAVSAYHNTCRHRGAELCAAEGRMGRLITCPYHAWAYAADGGRLVATGPATPTPDFVRDDHGLYPVASTLWNGFLFLSLNPDPGPLTPDLGLSALDNWPMDTLVTGHRVTRNLACNWKVFWENYNECLHCPGIHPELIDMVPVYGRGVMSPEETTGWTAQGNLKPGARTWSTDGQPCGPEFPDLTQAQRDAGHAFVTLYPTMYVVAHVDYIRAVRLEPTGPETTRLTAEWLFAPETLAQPGFDAGQVAAFATLVLDQDGAAAEMNQRGLRSPAYTSATLMPQEFDIARFHRWVTDRLETTP
ncbi:MAG: aromatic ring-hydroxylating oxygenase subunit alpha [Gemmobacter sp.]